MKSIFLFLLLLGLVEAVVKPLMIRLTQLGIRHYIYPSYKKLDGLLTIPANWKAFVSDAELFVMETVIPDELNGEQAEQLASYLLKNFDMEEFLSKARGIPQ